MTILSRGFFSFLVYLWQFCIVQILFWSKDTYVYFFCFLPIFDRKFSFFFFVFFWGQGWEFSLWVKVYGELGFWIKACRTAGHDICQGVGLASGLGIKGMSQIISLTHMQQWWLGNFMQNWSCMHPCGHSSIKFLWSCDTRAQDSFPYLSQPNVYKIRSFINLCIHSSPFWVSGKIFTAFTLQVYTHSFKN